MRMSSIREQMLVLLMGLLGASCAEERTSPKDSFRDTSERPDDSSTDTGVEDPWEREGYWTEQNELGALFDFSQAPEVHWEVWMNSSEDGLVWESPAVLIAHSFSSLSLFVYDDVLILVGVPYVIPEIDWGCDNPAHGQVSVLSTYDLVDWGTHYWPIAGAEGETIVDPALHSDREGELWLDYFPVPEKFNGDPASIPGDHEFFSARHLGEGFVAPVDAVYATPEGADPVVCLRNDTYHLFSTSHRGTVHATSSDGLAYETDTEFLWPGFTVPHCYEQDDQLHVVAHSPDVSLPPERLTILDAGGFVFPTPFIESEEGFRGHLTSLVVGEFLGSWRLFYAVLTNEPIPS